MGVFTISIEVGDPEGASFEPVDAIVGTDATYTVIPASTLHELGIEPEERGPFELADGALREFDIGQTEVRIDGQETTTLVVFGDEEMQPLLGAYTLEGLRLAVDPARQRLIQVPARLM